MRTQYGKKTDSLKSSYIPLIELNLDDGVNTFRIGHNAINYDPRFVDNS